MANGHNLPEILHRKTRIEIIDFYSSNRANLSDFFIPLFKHLIRIACQAKVRYITLECTDQMVTLLGKLGFVHLKSTIKRPTGHQEITEFHLMGLNVHKILSAKESVLDSKVWNNVFRELIEFLKAPEKKLPTPKPKNLNKKRYHTRKKVG